MLWWISTDPAHRGRGLGRSLLAQCFTALTMNGAHEVIAYVDDDAPTGDPERDRTAANRLYDVMGFAEIDRLWSFTCRPQTAPAVGPNPGTGLRTTDAEGMRVTGLLINTGYGGPAHQLTDLRLRRRRARVEDRAVKDTELRNLPFHDMAQTGFGCRSSRWPPTCSPVARTWSCLPTPRPTSPHGCGCRILAVAAHISCAPPAAGCSWPTPPGPVPT